MHEILLLRSNLLNIKEESATEKNTQFENLRDQIFGTQPRLF